ncbi:uncharacterized protein LOC126895370 [Daktulosphaira vitifoliae]|uniref:uncharacterized protein LOC126895370 n=1 Tax=Daktulosphaira vitifoliae TaxID=58002 RepID=UPI0021AA0DEA|nr:uncharacterized protein LOC126895370 [Daktulosphaira vitifoliae]
MIFKKYNLFLILLCVVITKICHGILFGRLIDKPLETALKLDTGFDYPSYDELCNLSNSEFKKKILKGDRYLENIVLTKKTVIMLLDLFCGNMYNFLQYMKLFSFFIENSLGQTYDIKTIILNESITKQFLVTLIEYDINDKLTIFWMIHLYTYYIQLFGNEIYRYNKNIKHTHDIFYKVLKRVSTELCRKKNKYEVNNFPLNTAENYSTLTNLIDVMNQRKENNKNVLKHTEEQENSFSLRSIYLRDIIDKKELLRTIIMDFGAQSENNFEAIYSEIYEEYTKARNYFWFDIWIKQIGIYQQKILNVFKTVLMHLVRKCLIYSSLMLNKKNTKSGLKRMYSIVENFVECFDSQEVQDVQKVFKSFNELPIFTENFNLYFIVIISIIESIINKIKPNSFNLILNNLISVPGYKSNINVRTKKYISDTILSVDAINTIEHLEIFTDSNDMNMSLVRIYLFMELFNKSFQNVNLKSILSYLTFIKIFELFSDRRDNNSVNEIRLLEL